MTTNRPIIFYHNSVEELAAETIRLSGCSCGTIQWNRFNDGWPNLYIDDIGRVKNRDVIFIASFHSRDVLFEQMAIVYDFPRYFVKSLRVIVPFYPVGTMERIDKEGEIATAKSMARIFSATPMTQSGP
ncbi:MAG: ribose-phosphate pyrophosphokinase-like domain-containing protein, partial [Nitrospirae bacterium]|nr:ribose-phosphate pyrophosphokinase-like domain-containing protein [Nitrospirota bacterium]